MEQVGRRRIEFSDERLLASRMLLRGILPGILLVAVFGACQSHKSFETNRAVGVDDLEAEVQRRRYFLVEGTMGVAELPDAFPALYADDAFRLAVLGIERDALDEMNDIYAHAAKRISKLLIRTEARRQHSIVGGSPPTNSP